MPRASKGANRSSAVDPGPCGAARCRSKETGMSNKSVWDDRPVLDHVHPLVYGAIVGLVLWFVVSAAWGFGADGYADYLIAVVGGFMLIAVAIPCVLWLVWWSNQGADAARRDSAVRGETLRDWSAGDLDTWQD